MAASRLNIQDFMRDIRLRSVAGGNTYGASIGTDNTTVVVTKNGVTLFSKVLWGAGGASAPTDASGAQNQDTVGVYDQGSGWPSMGSAQAFLNGLT